MVGRNYGTTSCVSHGFREGFFLSLSHFKSIETNDSIARIDTRSMDSKIYVGDHKT